LKAVIYKIMILETPVNSS